jgi:hypothetical protein
VPTSKSASEDTPMGDHKMLHATEEKTKNSNICYSFCVPQSSCVGTLIPHYSRVVGIQWEVEYSGRYLGYGEGALMAGLMSFM